MGALQDFIDIYKDIKNNDYLDTDEVNGMLNLKFGRTSIAKKAGNAILQFPVLTTDAISVQDLTMINKALEREYASFVRIATGLEDMMIVDPNKSHGTFKADYIKNFHQNIGTKSNIRIDKNLFESMDLSNKELLKPFSNDLRVNTLNEMTNSNNINYYGQGRKTTGRQALLSEYQRKDPGIHDKSQYTSQLLDNDVKKANELIPTTVDVPIFIMNKQGGAPYQSDILVGIKAITHLIKSEEMIYNVSTSIQEKRSLFRLIQWTTGEIAFFKDYLLMTDKIKNQAVNERSDSSTLWRSLRRRATEDKLRRMTFSKKDILPNATILITMDEVEYIQNNYNIDLFDDKKSVFNLMNVLFLLGFVIVDPAAELAYFMFDGQTSYQPVSYTALERENTSSREVKSILSLMNKY